MSTCAFFTLPSTPTRHDTRPQNALGHLTFVIRYLPLFQVHVLLVRKRRGVVVLHVLAEVLDPLAVLRVAVNPRGGRATMSWSKAKSFAVGETGHVGREGKAYGTQQKGAHGDGLSLRGGLDRRGYLNRRGDLNLKVALI